ncbi:MAG: outer membrane protein [Prevotella sp.]
MKKIIFMAFFALVSTFASAQELGVQGLYRTDSGHFGLGVQGRYNFTKEIRGAASFNYYFQTNNVSSWELNANAQYLFPVGNGFTLYPLAGLTYLHTTAHVDNLVTGANNVSSGKLGVNLGGGVDYQLNDKVKLNAEPRLQLVGGSNELVLSVGVVYSL